MMMMKVKEIKNVSYPQVGLDDDVVVVPPVVVCE